MIKQTRLECSLPVIKRVETNILKTNTINSEYQGLKSPPRYLDDWPHFLKKHKKTIPLPSFDDFYKARIGWYIEYYRTLPNDSGEFYHDKLRCMWSIASKKAFKKTFIPFLKHTPYYELLASEFDKHTITRSKKKLDLAVEDAK